ncbi:unnamed protein product [Chrysodeixis includens]|uniref:Chitin-binding type-2 domain-containing protein n=1 Tax=Chrysodeixis includens TaxID=689277 RepID=A0A9N8PYV9_CHRIL|nr:unnamed protein product [Chrysodeixis includens]
MFAYVCVALTFVAACTAQAQNPNTASNNICVKINSYTKIDDSCDTYIECIESVPARRACPDGLHYNAAAVWPQYPCGFPMDVPCVGRETLFFKFTCPANSKDSFSNHKHESNCYYFYSCILGSPRLLQCDPGLAFDPIAARCVSEERVDCSRTNVTQ